jgi:tetratricopeptide (TPR) repeat protein
MGKTAGCSTRNTLVKHGFNIAHVHSLNPDRFCHFLAQEKNTGEFPRHLTLANYISNIIRTEGSHVRWKVVTAFREPLSRMISAAFEGLRGGLPHVIGRDDDQALDEVTEFVLNKVKRYDPRSEFGTAWFDNELKPVFHIDLYQHPFNRAKGYSIYAAPKADILVLKFEMYRQCANQAFKEFMGIEDFDAVGSNVAEQKPYASLYSRFLDSVEFDSRFLDKVYNSKFARHFYSDREIQAFRKKWGGKDPKTCLIRDGKKAMKQGNYHLACELFNKALKISPQSANVYTCLGNLYYERKKIIDALRYYKKALSLAPYDRETVVNSGRLLAELGKKDDAAKLFLSYLSKNAEDRPCWDIMESLTGLKRS